MEQTAPKGLPASKASKLADEKNGELSLPPLSDRQENAEQVETAKAAVAYIRRCCCPVDGWYIVRAYIFN